MTTNYFVIKTGEKYISKLLKNKDNSWAIELSEQLKKAKRWKTEKGARKSLYKYIFDSTDGKEYHVIKKVERKDEKKDVRLKKIEAKIEINENQKTLIEKVEPIILSNENITKEKKHTNKFSMLVNKFKERLVKEIKYYI